jgi:hypothetical protein
MVKVIRPATGEDHRSSTETGDFFDLLHPAWMRQGKVEKLPLVESKKGGYFLRIPAAASRAAPIATRIVTIPTGEFCVVPAAAGAVVIAALETGTCVGAVVAADTVLTTGWMQWYCTIASALCPHTVLLHISYPFTPHCAMAVLSAIHWHGAVHAGALAPDVTWVSAIIPTPLAHTVPHKIATIPRIRMIPTYRFPNIPDHHSPAVPDSVPRVVYYTIG